MLGGDCFWVILLFRKQKLLNATIHIFAAVYFKCYVLKISIKLFHNAN